MPAFGDGRPALDVFEYLPSDLEVDCRWANSLKEGSQVVHEFARGDFLQEVVSSILDASIGKLYRDIQSISREYGSSGLALGAGW